MSFYCEPEQKQVLGPLTQLVQGMEEWMVGKISQKLEKGEALSLKWVKPWQEGESWQMVWHCSCKKDLVKIARIDKSSYLACDISGAMVIGIPSCIWNKAPTSPDWSDNVKKQGETNGKLKQCQHPPNV